MKKTFYTFLILFSLLASALFVEATFSDTSVAPSGSNKQGPIDASDENQSKNSSLTTKTFTAGTTATRLIQIQYPSGNISISTADGPTSSVRMVVDGTISATSLISSSGEEICTGTTSGSEDNGYPLVKC